MTVAHAGRSWRTLRVTPVLAVAGAGTGGALGTGLLSIPCWFHAATGLDCPFCGGSRALGALLRGELPGAVGFNAFAIVVVLPVLVAVLVAVARWEAGRARTWWPAGVRGRLLVAGLVAGSVVWWVVRNV